MEPDYCGIVQEDSGENHQQNQVGKSIARHRLGLGQQAERSQSVGAGEGDDTGLEEGAGDEGTRHRGG